jgi:hypothetical protein
MVQRWRSIAVTAVILAACTGGTANPATSSIPATKGGSITTTAKTVSVDDLTSEWRPVPLRIGDAALQQMDEDCLSYDFLPPGVSLVVADARGEGKVHLLYAGEDRQNGTCEATVSPNGGIQTEPRSATAEPVSDPPVEATELMVWGGQTSPGSARPEDWWQQIMGEAGTGIYRVIAHVPGVPPIVASLGGSWFTFWYNVDTEEQWDYELVGLDSAGNEVAEIRHPWGQPERSL